MTDSLIHIQNIWGFKDLQHETAGIQSIECESIIRECMHHCHPQTGSLAESASPLTHLRLSFSQRASTEDMECDFQLVFRRFILGTVKERMR